jgi:2-dehydro-3-deoxygluconokinase
MAGKVVLFGELLLRLAPRGFTRLLQADELEVRYTGAEVNAGVSLVNYGMEAWAVSRVPDSDIGQACINYLSRFRVNTEHVARGGERLGLFYLETGAAQRPSKIIYDRAHSAFSGCGPGDFDWDRICAGKDWLHFSGTAPALGPRVVAALQEGLAAARRHGLKVSCDLNYRAKLWSPADANRVMSALMPSVDVLIGNEEDAEKVFGIKAAGTDVGRGKLDGASYREVAVELKRRFGVSLVATTLRESRSASANGWSGLLYDGSRHYLSRSYEITPIVDRVGAGDAFSGGLIFALLRGLAPQECIEFAVAASCLKHSVAGDFNLASLAEVNALVAGEASGRVQR